MSTYTNLLFHIVYSTKYRKPIIQEAWRDDLYGYIGGLIREQKGTLLKIGGVADHVHILAKLSPTIAISDALRFVKSNSSKWVNEQQELTGKFAWQTGFAAFSVSESKTDVVRIYIANQREHHKATTFRDEFLALLKRHRIEFDERYVFETEIIQ